MKEELKIYCKFDNTKEKITDIISKIFLDYAENKKVKINNLQNLQNDDTEI